MFGMRLYLHPFSACVGREGSGESNAVKSLL